MNNLTASEARDIDRKFIKLWDKAKWTKEYNKKEWIELQNDLYDLFKLAGVKPGWSEK